ncbi:hypothetical protein NDU88_001815, partial [Pleurodeles waltl]
VGILGVFMSLIFANPRQDVCSIVSFKTIICTGIRHARNKASLPCICQSCVPHTLFKSIV